MENVKQKIQSYKLRYKIFATLATLSLLDMLLPPSIPFISKIILYPSLSLILNQEVVFTIIGLYSVSWIILYIPAIIFNRKIKKIEKNNPIKNDDKTTENEEIISAYNVLREKVSDYDEPNYELAEKVFLDFNDFNLRNIENGLTIYLGFIPKSLLPYPKNYIKCAYYIFLEKLKKENNLKMFENAQGIGVYLFFQYPDYEKYKENLTGKNTKGHGKKWLDDNALKDISPNPRESFKKMYGVYEVSEEDYNNSPNSIDSTDKKLLHDFGVLPEIEEDVVMEG